MASPTPKRQTTTSSREMPEVVDPRWLLKALGVVLVAAIVCAYLAVCLLVYQGGWQLMLHPAAKVDHTPSVPFDAVRFDAGATGKPRLSAWWIPSGANPEGSPTILFLHDGDGNLSNAAEQLDFLHTANVNIFAIDYGGYGMSDPPHPNQERMQADTQAALEYLVGTRHIPLRSIIPQGVGLGGSLAAALAAAHPEMQALILQNPDPDAPLRVSQNSKAGLLPMKLLVHESFDVSANLQRARQPRLLISGGLPAPLPELAARDQTFFRDASSPKMAVTIATGPQANQQYAAAIRRFLDEYVRP